MTQRLRIGVVGAGPWARAVHAPAILAHPGTELAGVWARRPAAAAELAGAHQVEPFGEIDELIAASDAISFAGINMPSSLHGKYIDDEDECCVDVETGARNQRDEDVMPGTATIVLPSAERSGTPVSRRLPIGRA